MPLSEHPLVHRNGVDAHLTQAVYRRPLHGMPVVESYRAVSVDSAFTRQRNVRTLVCVDERGVIETLRPFPFGKYHRQVVGSLGREFQPCAFGNVQVDVAFQRNGSFDEIVPCGYEHSAAAVRVASVDSFENGRAAVYRRVVFCTVVGYVINRIGEGGRYDVFQYSGNFAPFPGFFPGRCGGACPYRQQEE